MQISTKSRYGLRAMVELAINYGEGPVSLHEIAENQGISKKYLEQIVPHLKTEGLLRSVRGAGGGYELTKAPEEIVVLQILRTLEGPLALVDCVDSPKICDRKDICPTRDLWVGMQESLKEFLGSRTLDQLARKQEKVR
ncbi:Rrf2 family transcriptional regulator [Candidatus Bipolaricaulota bacterium]|nr:Rrf2 family transcriptional regulator [Candidatus Bipolaricaulota bacterium]